MQTATQLRASAELYLKIARRLSDRNACDQLQAVAAEILAHAAGLETQSRPPLSKSSGMAERQRQAHDIAADDPKEVVQTFRTRVPNHRVIQAEIGKELRALYSPPHQLPRRILTLLMQLNARAGATGGTSNEIRRDFP